MAEREATHFVSGVIEGFYGQPWTQEQRHELLDWLQAWGLNTYLYAPKDDLKHRAHWRHAYSPEETDRLQHLVDACRERRIHFLYALSPGLSIRYSSEADLHLIQRRFSQLLALGCEDFALLFDDIPVHLDSEDQTRWGSFAAAQCHVANSILNWLRERRPNARLLFCPTPYCGRMAKAGLGGANYLPTIGRELHPDITVFWTGPEIISEQITTTHLQEIQQMLRRKPLIWDNLHANDYDGRRFYCGPYAGRSPEIRTAVSGVLVNPNVEFPLNYIPVRTFALWSHCQAHWAPREAYLSAMREWLPRFTVGGHPVKLEDLVLLGDCYYLPHEEGPEAQRLYAACQTSLNAVPRPDSVETSFLRDQASRLQAFCALLSELDDRPLFYALGRRIWELREEMDLLLRCNESRLMGGPKASCASDFHLPGTYRGGMAAKLQRLLEQHADGTFTPTEPLPPAMS
jgi:protein O-GlcNAcase/histone acetyltransferase